METQHIDSAALLNMLRGAYDNLNRHADEVNDLNVFPIPDGDTGYNMLLTTQGGMRILPTDGETLGAYARRASDGMLLAARGNSGVILSQFADGIAAGLNGKETADVKDIADAFLTGVKHAYDAVVEPTEGTVLTVMREASEYAAQQRCSDYEAYFSAFLTQAKETLRKTPEMLDVLKKAGVVDSGGAGLIYLVEGASAALSGEVPTEYVPAVSVTADNGLNLDLFNEDSELTFGYCTELLLRLQNAKTDISSFNVDIIKDFLQSIGDSVVCFQSGSIVKIHVHTKEPYRVLEFCQKYGEYLTVKIENMSLQHNNLPSDSPLAGHEERKPFAVVAVASGEGIKQTFRDMGADYIIEDKIGMNPSADNFIEAFEAVNADTIFVLPNNGNIILAAQQAAKMYEGSDIRVINSKSVGDGYAALTMLDTDSGDADLIEEELTGAMQGVVTASVSKCVRNTEMDGFMLEEGQYIGFIGKEILAADNDRRDAACMLIDRLDFTDHEICIIVRGEDSDEEETQEIVSHIKHTHRGCEVYTIDGGQEIYSYILIVE